jgi:hypothetical protein
VQYAADLTEPVYANGLTAGIQGRLSERVTVSGSAAYMKGDAALNPNARILDSRAGTVRANFGLTRLLAVYGEYLYYFYNFSQDSLATPGMPLSLERIGLRGGITLSVSTLRR